MGLEGTGITSQLQSTPAFLMFVYKYISKINNKGMGKKDIRLTKSIALYPGRLWNSRCKMVCFPKIKNNTFR